MDNDSYQVRKLKITIVLGSGNFAEGGNTLIITDLRCIAQITQVGGKQKGEANISIFGLSQDKMNQLTSLQYDTDSETQQSIVKHIITVEADGAICFYGTVLNSWGVYNQQPDVFLYIYAITQYHDQIAGYPSYSKKGSVKVADIFKMYADSMVLNLENNGVDIFCENPNFSGSVIDQAQQLATQCNIDVFYDGYTMVIIPKGHSRNFPIPLITKDTGMVSYPSFDNLGVNFRCLFNPMIHFLSTIQIDGPITRANGKWVVQGIRYILESEKPGGAWFMDIRGAQGQKGFQAN